MIDFAAAQSLLAQQVRPLPVLRVDVRSAMGSRLALDVCATCDAPPFDKSMMDGYAVALGSLAESGWSLRLAGTITAGQPATVRVAAGEAVAVMTGAPIPPGADAVVMLEHARLSDDRRTVAIESRSMTAGQNILSRGKIFETGQVVVPKGRVITPPWVGLLLETGNREVSVYRQPRVAVLTTGNELCPADAIPGPGQIRNTNGPLLTALLRDHARVTDLGIAADDRSVLKSLVGEGLRSDILVVTGGVSTGELDLVPGVLEALDVAPVFHKVALKPGKPVWFGVADGRDPRCLVFGLPGNPVSSLACCVLFVFQAIRYLAGGDRIPYSRGRLAIEHVIRGDRPTFWPASLANDDGQVVVRPLGWRGSADQRCLVETQCLAYFPRGDETYRAGTLIEFVPLSVW